MFRIKSRWELIRSYIGWEDYLGFTILVIGVLGFIIETFPIINELRAELVGIGITVLIIDNANEAIKRREEKKRLILQMGSPDNAFAIEAVRQLRTRGWITDGSLRGAHLGSANLEGAYLGSANLMGATMYTVNLENANLRDANLKDAYLGGANMWHAILMSATMEKADLEGAILVGADLRKVDLRFANLGKANLQGANFEGADLRNIDLHEARLFMANLQRAALLNADLVGANLEEAIVTPEQLEEAKSLEGAIMPDGTLYEEEDFEENEAQQHHTDQWPDQGG